VGRGRGYVRLQPEELDAVWERLKAGMAAKPAAMSRDVVGFEVEFLGAYVPLSIAASSLSRSG
jgi:hypothetical protein